MNTDMFFFFLDEMEKGIPEDLKDEPVRIKGAYNLKTSPAKQYEVSMAYGDIVLMIAVLHDYLKNQDAKATEEDILWNAYYKGKFQKMADRLSEQIGYDYDKALAKCLKKQEKESKSDIGEDAMALAVKYGARKAPKPEEKNGESDTGRDQEEGKGNRDPDRLQNEGT